MNGPISQSFLPEQLAVGIPQQIPEEGVCVGDPSRVRFQDEDAVFCRLEETPVAYFGNLQRVLDPLPFGDFTLRQLPHIAGGPGGRPVFRFGQAPARWHSPPCVGTSFWTASTPPRAQVSLLPFADNQDDYIWNPMQCMPRIYGGTMGGSATGSPAGTDTVQNHQDRCLSYSSRHVPDP